MWNALTHTLGALADQYEQICSLQEEKRHVLIALDMERLEKLIAREELFVRTVELLEDERRGLLKEIGIHTPGVTPETDMEELSLLAPTDEIYRAVHTASTRLSQLVKEAKERVGDNALLTEGALIAVNRQLGLIGGAVVDPVYGSDGDEQVRHLNKNLDYRA